VGCLQTQRAGCLQATAVVVAVVVAAGCVLLCVVMGVWGVLGMAVADGKIGLAVLPLAHVQVHCIANVPCGLEQSLIFELDG
jgi:hypothetical protein